MKEILVVLGSPNTADGELWEIGIDRLNACIELFDPVRNLILCTGGFGAHFNSTDIPHAQYALDYLEKNRIPKSQLLEIALSVNTVDDAVKAKPILAKYNLPIKIITSCYHLERVKIVFEAVLPEIEKEYVGVSHKHVPQGLIEHEKKAIAGLLKNGVYF